MPAVGGINPYTFVKSGVPTRCKPSGHDRLLPGNFSGRITCTLEAATPLHLRDHDGAGNLPRAMGPDNALGAVILPGSGIKGAVRSLYETLTNSCFRIVDLDYVGVHRTPVIVGFLDGWSMAVVTKTRDGLPTEVQLCTEDATVLASPGTGDLTGDELWCTGDRFNGVYAHRAKPGHRDLFRLERRSDGDWILLATHVQARPANNAVRFAAGKLGTPADGRHVGEEVRVDLARALEGSQDAAAWDDPLVADFEDIVRGHTVIARRALARKQLSLGMPIWVKTEGADRRVTRIRLSQAWRDRGAYSVKDRLGESAPCNDPEHLCPACQVFGSAGEDGDRGDEATRQLSYRGHVRFMDAPATSEPDIHTLRRAPLSSPKLTAGQFYLERAAVKGQFDERPLAFWGSPAEARVPDQGTEVTQEKPQLRGRKFYWATNASPDTGLAVAATPHRSRAVPDHHKDTQLSTVQVAAKGAQFDITLTFDNLAPDQIGALVCALDPRRVWPGHKVALRLGGGKPFGWGALMVTAAGIRAECATADARYLGREDADDQAPPDLDACVAAFLATQPGLADRLDLRNALTVDYVPDAQVHYPAVLNDPFGEPDFKFWQLTRGQKFTGKTPPRPLVPLPNAAEPAAAQRMIVEG